MVFLGLIFIKIPYGTLSYYPLVYRKIDKVQKF